MSHSIGAATADDLPAVEALLPRLAAFDVPNGRASEELWHGDRELLRAWARGERGDVDVAIARDGDDTVVGLVAVSERAELLSGEPSAHLEILAVDADAEGAGLGSALLAEAERLARARGLPSMSLHVFAANGRARALYARHGFDEELLRCFKRLA